MNEVYVLTIKIIDSESTSDEVVGVYKDESAAKRIMNEVADSESNSMYQEYQCDIECEEEDTCIRLRCNSEIVIISYDSFPVK